MRVTPMPQILTTQPALVIFGQKPRMRVVASLRHCLQERNPRLCQSSEALLSWFLWLLQELAPQIQRRVVRDGPQNV